jgi:molybdate transport system permease protein
MSDVATHALWLSTQLAWLTVVVATPLAIALATAMARTHWCGKAMLDTLILLPLGLPPACIGVSLWLGWAPDAALGQWLREALGWRPAFVPLGLALATLLTTLPLMARLLRTAFEATDPMLLAVARSLGASRWQAWWTVTLPMAAPAVASAVALGWAAAWGEALAVLLLMAWLQPPAHGVASLNMGLGPGSAAHSIAASSAWGLAAAAWGVALLAVGCSELARRHGRRMWRTRLDLGPARGDGDWMPP